MLRPDPAEPQTNGPQAPPPARGWSPRAETSARSRRATALSSARSYSIGGRPRGVSRNVARAVVALGLLLFLLGSGTIAYAQWVEWQHVAQRPPRPQDAWSEEAARPAASGTEVPRGTIEQAPALALARGEAGVPVWLEISRIQVDAPVMEVGVQDGEYQVPSFDIGHHADSTSPGEPGNSIFNGHLQTINAGRVFARLHEVVAGDRIQVYTRGYRLDWEVQGVRIVPNSERDYLQPTSSPRITLYTCDGSYDLVTKDYTHRRVVVGGLVGVTPRPG